MSQYLKSIVGLLVAGLTAALTALADGDGISSSEWVTIVLAAVTTLGAVYAVPNAEPAGVAEQAAQDIHPGAGEDLDHDSDLPAGV